MKTSSGQARAAATMSPHTMPMPPATRDSAETERRAASVRSTTVTVVRATTPPRT